ncbi:ankyrin repeat-containing domain protein [Chytridium lagenaria]|nr:ankyrin repeat-containing domain protein [Chytridium lagenaria]
MMLITASEKGRTDIVRVLVKEFDCDPSQSDHEALRRAAARGHSDVVALLLESGGVDPGAFWERAVRDAAALGHAEVVGLLLDKTSREGLLDDQPLRLATLHQHPSIVKLLLDSHRVDPNRALPIAARTGNKEILELLLGTGRCDPAYDHQHALRWGCALGHREVVRVLLATGVVIQEWKGIIASGCRVITVTYISWKCYQKAMAAAVKHGHIECVKALLDFQGGRVAEFAIGALVNEAMVRSFWDIAEVLRDGC